MTDYEAVSNILARWVVESSIDDQALVICMARDFADYFVTENPGFDRGRFLVACGLSKSKKAGED